MDKLAKRKEEKKKRKQIAKTVTQEKLQTKYLILLALLLGVVFAAQSPILKGEFSNYDDDIYILDNPLIQEPNGENLKTLFTDYYQNQYSPVAMIIMAAEFKLMGDSPYPFKLVSILLHLLNTVLVFFLIQALFRKGSYSILVAAFFALTPIQVESVAWLSASMKIGTYSAFSILSLICYIRFVDKQKWIFYISSIIFFLLSCFSKEQAVVLSLLLPAIDYIRDRKLTNKTVIAEKIPFFVISLIFGLITLGVSDSQQGAGLENYFSFSQRLMFSNAALVIYISKLFLPINLSAFYTYPLRDSIPAFYYLTPLVSLAIVGSLFFFVKNKQKILAFAVFFFLVNLALPLVIQIMSVRDSMMADRYLYLPAIGFFLFVVVGVEKLLNRPGIQKTAIIAASAYLVLTTSLLYGRSKVWESSASIFTDVIEKAEKEQNRFNPFLALAYNNRGVYLKKEGKQTEALEDYNKAIKSNAGYEKAWVNRGNIYLAQGKLDDALSDYNQALKLNPRDEIAYSCRGVVYAQTNRSEEAIADFKKAIEIRPDFKDALDNRSLLYYQAGEWEKSLADINTSLATKPDDASLINMKGLVLFNLKRNQEAELAYNQSIQLKPSDGRFWLNRSNFYFHTGEKAKALQDALHAKQLGVAVNDAYIQALKND